MVAFVKSVTFDCDDALVLARFWGCRAGFDRGRGQHVGAGVRGTARMGWFHAVVPAGSRAQGGAKNRQHFDLRAPGNLQHEVTRLVQLRAHVISDGSDLVVMIDPEGNEFCIEP